MYVIMVEERSPAKEEKLCELKGLSHQIRLA